MARTALARGAGVARKALVARKKMLSEMAANLRVGEDELHAGPRPDSLDRAADLEIHEVLERLQAVENREIREIDAALVRIARGTYGRCESCGTPVGQPRLRAVPTAKLCMSCAARP